MKIAIIGAMAEEVAQLRDQLQQRQTVRHTSGCTLYSGQLAGAAVVLLQSGVGKVAAAMGTTLLLEHHQPTWIINTGSAGGLARGLCMGDIVISDQVGYHDADLTARGYPLGQLPHCPPTFGANRQLIELAHHCSAVLQFKAVSGMICSGDTFINGTEKRESLQRQFPKAIAVEMEAASIAHVCALYQTPFVVVRAISDGANEEAHLSFDAFLALAAQRSCQLVEAMVAKLALSAAALTATGSDP